MQMQSLTTQDLKNLLQKIVGQPTTEHVERPPVPVLSPLVTEPPPSDDGKIKELEATIKEQHNTIDRLTASLQELKENSDGQDTKNRLVRLITEKKELEDQLTALSCEKATLAARLQNLNTNRVKLEESEAGLTDKIHELVQTVETTTQTLSERDEELVELKAKIAKSEAKHEQYRTQIDDLQKELTRIQGAEFTIRELEEKLESESQAHAQELAVCQACIQEQKEVLAEEQKNHRLLAQEHLFMQKRAEEQENHLRLLEQHLARRVKECALSSKQIDDLMDRTTELQNSLTLQIQKLSYLEETLDSARKVENALRIELDAQANSLQDELRGKDEEIESLGALIQKQEEELVRLRRIQAQFLELEALFKRSSEPQESFSFSTPPLFIQE